MPPLSELPGSLSREKFLRALQRLGFNIDEKGGKGSHVIAFWGRTQKSVTIPHQQLPKQVLKYILVEIEKVTNGEIDWNKIKKEI